jgi:hypothetical protein
LQNRVLLDRFHHPSRFDALSETTTASQTFDDVLMKEGLTDVDFIKLDA